MLMNLISRIINGIELTVEHLIKGPMTKSAVEIALEQLEKNGPERLEWRTSIVDLLKLLDLPYAMANRAELARELNFEHYVGSAEDNIKLHELVMQEVAKRYIPIPHETAGGKTAI